MKIAKFTQYGPPEVIKFEEIPVPEIMDDELLIKVVSTSVTVADVRIRGANFPKGYGVIALPILGLFSPSKKVQIPGTVYSGEVVKVGSKVKEFQVGDEVMGMKTPPNFGTYCEYIAVGEGSAVTKKPKSISHQKAAGLLFGGTTALYFLRDLGKIKKDDKVLIVGSSGAVGTNLVQLAKYFGAEVSGVCGPKNVVLVKKLGATKVFDYTKVDINSVDKYDLVINTAPGYDLDTLLNLANEKGKLLLVLSDLWGLIVSIFPFLKPNKGNKKIIVGVAPERKEDVEFLAKLASKGELDAVIDKTYKFDEVVEAHRYVDMGHKVGNVILEIN